jgi:hypothetical protein
VAESRAEGRFEAHQTNRLSPLVGRDEELSLLLGRWRQAADGDGQVVLPVRRAGHAQNLLAARGPAELPPVIAQAP